MKNLKQIQSILAAQKKELRKKYKIKNIGIFGFLSENCTAGHFSLRQIHTKL